MQTDNEGGRNLDPRAMNAERATITAEDCGASEAALFWQPLIEPGMYVTGEAGDIIGQIKEVRAGDFLVDRGAVPGLASAAPIYLPFERIRAMVGDRLRLDVPSSQIDEHASVPAPFNF